MPCSGTFRRKSESWWPGRHPEPNCQRDAASSNQEKLLDVGTATVGLQTIPGQPLDTGQVQSLDVNLSTLCSFPRRSVSDGSRASEEAGDVLGHLCQTPRARAVHSGLEGPVRPVGSPWISSWGHWRPPGPALAPDSEDAASASLRIVVTISGDILNEAKGRRAGGERRTASCSP